MLLLRRLVRQVGAVTIGQWVWRHRGSAIRTLDLARHAPQRVRSGQTDELLTEARAVLALDNAVPTDTSIRITGIEDGSVTLAGRAEPTDLEAARSSLLKVPSVVDVQTDGAGLPSTEQVLARANA